MRGARERDRCVVHLLASPLGSDLPRSWKGAGVSMDLATAIRHLRSRLAVADAADSRHRPHWTQPDMDAVSALVDIPASAEQIALARIEGRTANLDGYVTHDQVRVLNTISRRALGLPT